MKHLRMPIAAITDEFSSDLATALEPMAAIGMTGAELRVVFWKALAQIFSVPAQFPERLRRGRS